MEIQKERIWRFEQIMQELKDLEDDVTLTEEEYYKREEKLQNQLINEFTFEELEFLSEGATE